MFFIDNVLLAITPKMKKESPSSVCHFTNISSSKVTLTFPRLSLYTSKYTSHYQSKTFRQNFRALASDPIRNSYSVDIRMTIIILARSDTDSMYRNERVN